MLTVTTVYVHICLFVDIVLLPRNKNDTNRYDDARFLILSSYWTAWTKRQAPLRPTYDIKDRSLVVFVIPLKKYIFKYRNIYKYMFDFSSGEKYHNRSGKE